MNTTHEVSGLFPTSGPGALQGRPHHVLNPLLGFPGRLLPDLPAPFRLVLNVSGAPVPVAFENAVPHEAHTVLAANVTFEAEELRALIVGVEADRIWHGEFLGFCFEKWRNPEFRVDASIALAGANPDLAQPPWSLRRVLRRLQATLCAEQRDQPYGATARDWSAAA